MAEFFNLISPEIQARTAAARRTRLMAVCAGISCAILLSAGGLIFAWNQWTASRISQMEQSLVWVGPQVERANQVIAEIAAQSAELAALEKIIAEKIDWPGILQIVGERMPEDLWLTGFTADSGKTIIIKGRAKNLMILGAFIYELNRLPIFTTFILVQAKEFIPVQGGDVLTEFQISGALAGG